MKFDLAAMTKRVRNPRRSVIPLRDIRPPGTMAADLFRSCYLPVVQAWDDAQAPIMAEYERTLAGITQDALLTDSAGDLDVEISSIDRELQRIYLEITPRLRRWVLMLERWLRGKWTGAVLSATGVDLTTLIGPEDVQDTIEAAIARNAALIKDVGAQARGRISEAVFRGLNNRSPARDVAAEIRQAVDMSRRRSINIASHQLSAISESLADERRRQAGITRWMWVHSFKKHPRLVHVARNGKIYAETEAEADPPDVLPPPEDRPGQLPFCGCRSRAVISFD